MADPQQNVWASRCPSSSERLIDVVVSPAYSGELLDQGVGDQTAAGRPTISVDGNGATVTDTNEDIDEEVDIGPPDAAEIEGSVTTIH